MTLVVHHPAIRQRIRPRYTRAEIDGLLHFLAEQGTLRFAPLPTGLFSAAAPSSAVVTGGYNNVWVRDNIYIALAHTIGGQHAVAIGVLQGITRFYARHRARLEAIADGRVDPGQIMQRPHVRFDGLTLDELAQQWAHAQNDALGYFLWACCREALAGRLQPDFSLLSLFVRYFAAIRYWQDEDSGHWEERRKISASSIGVVVAALRAFRQLAGADESHVDELIASGERALQAILPAECVQPDPLKYRRTDAALLFLAWPLQVAEPGMAERIVADVSDNLMGEYGIRRYLGDSYWTADYTDKLPAEIRTSDFSEHQESRDALGRPGEEAQWCTFDPIVSIIAGRRYRRTGDAADRDRQVHHLNRALGQLTAPDYPGGELRCPEAYYLRHGRYVPNDHVPLLWTQANLWMALQEMREVADQ